MSLEPYLALSPINNVHTPAVTAFQDCLLFSNASIPHGPSLSAKIGIKPLEICSSMPHAFFCIFFALAGVLTECGNPHKHCEVDCPMETRRAKAPSHGETIEALVAALQPHPGTRKVKQSSQQKLSDTFPQLSTWRTNWRSICPIPTIGGVYWCLLLWDTQSVERRIPSMNTPINSRRLKAFLLDNQVLEPLFT